MEQRRLGVMQNKEQTQGSRPEADLYGTRSEGGVSKATWIGSRVGIGNLLGIDWEQQQLFDCEGRGYAGMERKWD